MTDRDRLTKAALREIAGYVRSHLLGNDADPELRWALEQADEVLAGEIPDDLSTGVLSYDDLTDEVARLARALQDAQGQSAEEERMRTELTIALQDCERERGKAESTLRDLRRHMDELRERGLWPVAAIEQRLADCERERDAARKMGSALRRDRRKMDEELEAAEQRVKDAIAFVRYGGPLTKADREELLGILAASPPLEEQA